MATYTLNSVEPTQPPALVASTIDTITYPAADDNIRSGRTVVVWNLTAAQTIRVTAGDVGFAADPNGSTATLIAAGKVGFIPLPSGFAACDVKIVSSGVNTYSIARTELAVLPSAPTPLPPFGALRGFATVDLPSIATAGQTTGTITVTGAALGDIVQVDHSLTQGGLTLTGYVSAANTVTYIAVNNSGGAIDLASGTIAVRVTR